MKKYKTTSVDVMVGNQISLMYADDETISNINDTGLYDQASYEVCNTVRFEEI